MNKISEPEWSSRNEYWRKPLLNLRTEKGRFETTKTDEVRVKQDEDEYSEKNYKTGVLILSKCESVRDISIMMLLCETYRY